MIKKDSTIITKDNIHSLPIGTVLVEHSKFSKRKEKNYAILTEDGLKHFQYSWFLKKFAYDPAEHGIGISWNINETEQFKIVETIKLKPVEQSKKLSPK